MTAKKTGALALTDESVREKTGKSWKQWFSLLDRWSATKKEHKVIAKRLRDKYSVDAWWAQMITVRYELERGLRVTGEKCTGDFEISVQRTIASTQKKAYEAFTDAKLISRWFAPGSRNNVKAGGHYSNPEGDHWTYRTVTPPRRLLFTWENEKYFPGSSVEVSFTRTDSGKVAARIQHMNLPDSKARAMMKEGWTWTLDSLKSFLETGEPVDFEVWKKAQKTK